MDNIVDNKSSKRRKILILCVLAVVLLISIFLVNAFVIYEYSKIDETRRADTAIILGAGVEDNKPSPVFRERIDHGIWLYKNGYTETLIFTGGYSNDNEVSDAVVAMNYALGKGVSNKDIFFEEESSITQENLYYAKQVMDEHKLENALIVSDPLHMKRAMLIAKDYGIEAYTSPTRTSVYKSWNTKAMFLGREVFFYVGYGIYRIFGF